MWTYPVYKYLRFILIKIKIEGLAIGGNSSSVTLHPSLTIDELKQRIDQNGYISQIDNCSDIKSVNMNRSFK